jgi:hypothetical protein
MPAQSRLTSGQPGQILGPTMVTGLWLQVEVAGCPTVCRHCWAQGVPYRPMPLDDVAWVLEQAHRFCDQHGLGFGAYPMHELAAHPHAAELLRLFADHVGAAEFEPLSTTGVPLAVREDWRQLLAAAKLGTTTVWVAFHGVGTEHDRQVNRTGAFTETCLAVQRVHAAGLRAGANVFLTTANAPQTERLLGVLQRLQLDGMAWTPATYYPTPRGRRNERLRPQLAELLPFADRICQAGSLNGEGLGEPRGAHRGGLGTPCAGGRLADVGTSRWRGAGAGVPPQPRPAPRRGGLVPRAARQPAHRRSVGDPRRRAPGRRPLFRGAVVWLRPAAVGRRAGHPTWRQPRARSPLQRGLSPLSVAGPRTAGLTTTDIGSIGGSAEIDTGVGLGALTDAARPQARLRTDPSSRPWAAMGCCSAWSTARSPGHEGAPQAKLVKLADPATQLRPTAARVLKTLRADGPQTASELVSALARQGRAIRPATVETALDELDASGLAAPDGTGPARRWSPLAPSGDQLLDVVDLRGAHDFRHTFATWLRVQDSA